MQKIITNTNILFSSNTLVKDEIRYLKDNGQNFFYHFTSEDNLNSIEQNGGLFSWYSCDQRGIFIPCAGGDLKSRQIDWMYKLHDYARLSFCCNHPMAHRLHKSGIKLVLFKISLDILELGNVLFSDMNATDRNHNIFKGFDGLKKINLNATHLRYVRKTSPYFHEHQAEVMVRSHIPQKYILDMEKMYFSD